MSIESIGRIESQRYSVSQTLRQSRVTKACTNAFFTRVIPLASPIPLFSSPKSISATLKPFKTSLSRIALKVPRSRLLINGLATLTTE